MDRKRDAEENEENMNHHELFFLPDQKLRYQIFDQNIFDYYYSDLEETGVSQAVIFSEDIPLEVGDEIGIYDSNALISDGEKKDSLDLVISVVPVNDPLILSTVIDGQAVEETVFSKTITWTDIDSSGADSYSASIYGGAAEWLTLGPVIETNGVFSVLLSGTPDDENLFQNDISLKIVDLSEGEAVEKNIYFSIAIDAINDAPVVVSYSGTTEILEEESFEASIYDFVIEDIDNDFPFDFTLQAISGTENAVSDDALTITPASDYVGTLDVNYSISDGTTSVNFVLTMTVIQVNDAPSISRYNGAGSIAEDSEITFSSSQFGISDSDGLDQTFTISVLEGSNYIIVADGAGLKPVENFNGSLSVNVVAKDQDGALSNAFQFDLNVYAP